MSMLLIHQKRSSELKEVKERIQAGKLMIFFFSCSGHLKIKGAKACTSELKPCYLQRKKHSSIIIINKLNRM